MKKTIIMLVVGAALFTMTGCGDGAGGAIVKGVDVQLPDGRTVTCVSQDGGGVDCDWSGAR